jgi:hypothetical protein
MGVCFGVDEEEIAEVVEALEEVVVERNRGRGFIGRRRFARSVERMMGDQVTRAPNLKSKSSMQLDKTSERISET